MKVQNLKKMLSVVLISCFCLSSSFASLGAMTASSSSAERFSVASSSNAIHFQSSLMDDMIMPLPYSGFPSVTNTINYGGSMLELIYLDMSGIQRRVYRALDASGYASVSLPDDCASVVRLGLNMSKNSIPRSGTYTMQYRFSSNTGIEWSRVRVYTTQENSNVQTVTANYYPSFQQFSGDVYFSSTVEIGSVDHIVVTMEFSNTSTSMLPAGGYFAVNYQKSDSSTPDFVTAGGATTSEDIQENISNSVGDISSGVDQMNDTLQEIVQTISNQLEAFWLQLYGLIYEPWVNNDNANTNKITSSIDSMNSDLQDSISDNAGDIISNQNSNTTEITNNIDQNTNTITNGYDNSRIDSDNDRLSDKLDEYGQQEDELMEDVSDGLSGIDFDIDFDSILSSIQLTSDFLQDLYDASGGFKLVINCALLLSFASCAVGLYRLKGGG